MAGLPKKYAKMGFKKGWKEYKKTKAYKRKNKSTTRKARTTSTTSKRSRSMAKKRMSKQMRHLTGGMAYGAVREPVSDGLRKVAGNFGLPGLAGEFTDELVMGAVSWYASKGKLPLIPKRIQRNAGYAGLSIEGARVGAVLLGDVASSLFNFGGMQTAGSKAGSQLRATIRS